MKINKICLGIRNYDYKNKNPSYSKKNYCFLFQTHTTKMVQIR
jgi:hypothetical protein